MSVNLEVPPSDPSDEVDTPRDEKRVGGPDRTGRERLVRNVVSSWAGYLVMVVMGFIYPRIMDQKLGQETLGLWDFGWSVVAYFGVVQLGTSSSVNRQVARYRAQGDSRGVRRVVSCVLGLNLLAGAVAVIATAAAVALVPSLLHANDAATIADARWVVAFLGLTVASELSFTAFQGVISGCHRFDLQSAITAGFETANALAVTVALLLGGGLRILTFIVLVSELATEVARVACAYRICPELKVGWSHVDLEMTKHVLRFNVKDLLSSLSQMLLVQGNKVILASSLGPAALAVFSRPLALIKIAETFTNKFAYVLTPTASSLQGSGEHEELRRLLVQATRFAAALVLPMVVGLTVLGEPLMLVWMGPRYQPGPFFAVLALGSLASLASRPAATIMLGLNRHGRLGLAAAATALLGLAMGLLNSLVLGWGLLGTALAIAVPTTILGIISNVYSCRQVGVTLSDYFRNAWLAPAACSAVFAVVLAASRVTFADRPLAAVASGCLSGGVILALLYWRFVVPDSIRRQLSTRLEGLLRRGRSDVGHTEDQPGRGGGADAAAGGNRGE
jgi:O-antigen/teichoic acid export membrane protein